MNKPNAAQKAFLITLAIGVAAVIAVRKVMEKPAPPPPKPGGPASSFTGDYGNYNTYYGYTGNLNTMDCDPIKYELAMVQQYLSQATSAEDVRSLQEREQQLLHQISGLPC